MSLDPSGNVALSDMVCDALTNLRLQPQRTMLALLGVVIGTGCVITMLSIGHMAQHEAVKAFSASGVDMLVVQASLRNANGGGEGSLNTSTLRRLPSTDARILAAASVATGTVTAQVRGQEAHISVAAAGPEIQDLASLQVRDGRRLTVYDQDSLVALIGSDFASKFPSPKPMIAVGDRVRLGRYVFQVVGVLAPRSVTAFDPSDFAGGVVVPSSDAARVLSSEKPNAAVIRIQAGADADAVGTSVAKSLQAEDPSVAIQIQSARQLIATLKAQKAVHTRLLASIGAVSLVVGGIGVMNVMFMSVLERRREIGLRMAVGATPRDIQRLFLTEAVMLSTFGGIAGTVVGVVVAWVVALMSKWEFSLDLSAIPLGLGVAIVVGVGFGLYPAVKASRLSPIEALRGG